MASPPTHLHFVLFPLMMQGHMLPMVDIARLLAQRATIVTICTTPVNANRIKSVIHRAVQANLKIQIVELPFPSAEAGLPQGCESFDLLPTSGHAVNMLAAMNLLKQPAEKMLKALSPPPSCIISDGGFPWTSDLAKKMNIPRLVFYGPGCFPFLCIHIVTHTNILDEIESNSEYFALPGLPDRIEVTKPQAATWGKGYSKEHTEMFERMLEADKSTYGIVVNSFNELETKYVEEFAKAKGKQVWCVGPVSLCNKSFLDITERGKARTNEPECWSWLDSRDPGSVVYVCLGSLSNASTEQAIELALGMELSNVPFIWYIRQTSDEFEKWLLVEGYEERIKDRGLMIRGWAPQILILSHQAIGGFITHCGWNSTLEGISAGIPMVTWPLSGEQFINERFIIQVLDIGVSIGAKVPAIFKVEAMIKRENVEIAVKRLMKDDEEGEVRRKRAKEYGKMAKRAMEEGGSSHINMTSMIEAITQEIAKNTTTTRTITTGSYPKTNFPDIFDTSVI